MKKGIILTALVCFTAPVVFGTIITNTNQSAQYLRLLSRGASTEIDAVYYNPAGVLQMDDGFHFSFHNQTVFQDKTVVNNFPFLNESEYLGEVNVPFFPSFFAAFKTGKFALSFGFGPNSGGGSADFASGLPSFETSFSMMPTMLTLMGLPTTAYSVDIAFNGKSVFYGFQLNASIGLTDTFSVAAGARYISAVNNYEGSIGNVMINPQHPLINPTGAMISAPQFFTLIGDPLTAALTSDMSLEVKQTGTGFTPIVGLHFKPVEQLNIGVRYEFKTKLELTNDTTVDDSGLFPDGYSFRKDIPAILAVGVDYALMEKLRAMLTFQMFFDKSANWEGLEDYVDSNSFDIGFGLEYNITPSFLISAGYLYTKVGVNEDYQSELDFQLSSNAVAAGGKFTINNKFDIDLGAFYVMYQDDDKTINYLIGPFLETYKQTSLGVAIGLTYHLTK
ncbi:MAG: hypothetical protein JXB26_14945 [Candidatus Aminicenantes bacterium]|nr:hypothetical protein [Candidatus Aminicenantes bacterium]